MWSQRIINTVRICKQFANEDGKWISDDKILSFTSYQTCLNIHVLHSLLSFEILNGRKRGISCDHYCVINIIEQFCENEIKNLRTISSESEMVN